MTLLWSLDLSTFCFELVYCDSFKYFWMSSLVNLMFQFDVGFMYFCLLVEVILLQCGYNKTETKDTSCDSTDGHLYSSHHSCSCLPFDL